MTKAFSGLAGGAIPDRTALDPVLSLAHWIGALEADANAVAPATVVGTRLKQLDADLQHVQPPDPGSASEAGRFGPR